MSRLVDENENNNDEDYEDIIINVIIIKVIPLYDRQLDFPTRNLQPELINTTKLIEMQHLNLIKHQLKSNINVQELKCQFKKLHSNHEYIINLIYIDQITNNLSPFL